MTSTFIFNDETILCQKTLDGWWPLQVQLPNFDSLADVATVNDSECLQAYQVGRVELVESLAPNHWKPDCCVTNGAANSDSEVSMDVDAIKASAPATSAITYGYAVANNIALPVIIDSNLSSISDSTSDSTSDSNAFITYRQLITQLPMALSAQLSQAVQLLRWQADTQFCSRCGSKVSAARLDERAMVCKVCQLRQYPRVQPCVITAITRPNPQTGEMQVLLAHHHRYGKQSQPLQYGLIAGFVEVGESLEHAVVREVAEEVGLGLTDIRYVSSQPWPFPSNLMLGFRASYASGDIVLQEDELSHADFFDISNLPKIPFKGSIAYELIAQIVHEQGLSL
ncbi:NAD+ diphosphatase [Psychrobacter sp. PL19]|uniref:NAD(+) diphosphatase n=1 Tax=Psychrobacter sp. PL19 TaxID=2760711 RepID=UPI001AE28811